MYIPRVALTLLEAALLVSASPVKTGRPDSLKDIVPQGLEKSRHLRPTIEKRDEPQFLQGQPIDGKGKGGPISGTVHPYDT